MTVHYLDGPELDMPLKGQRKQKAHSREQIFSCRTPEQLGRDYSPTITLRGYTECFRLDVLTKILQMAKGTTQDVQTSLRLLSGNNRRVPLVTASQVVPLTYPRNPRYPFWL